MSMTKREVTEVAAINQILYAHGVAAMINIYQPAALKMSRTKTPTFVSYRIQLYQPDVKLSMVKGLQPEIQEAISNIRKCRTPVRISSNPLSIEIPRDDARTLELTGDIMAGLPGFTGVLGRSYSYGKAETQYIELPDPNRAHTIIVGQNGSGKSNIAQGMICSMAYNTSPERLQMVMIDPKNRSLVPLRNLPHVRAWTNKADEAASLLAWVDAEIERRTNGASPSPNPRLWVIVEELAALAKMGVDVSRLERTALMGRELGVHILALAQKPTRGELGDQLMSQFNVRIVGLMQDSHDAHWATGRKNSGAEALPGRGSVLLIRDGDEPVRVQSFFVADVAALAARAIERWTAVEIEPLNIETMPTGRLDQSALRMQRDLDRVREFLVANYDWARDKLRHGAKQELVRLLLGQQANVTGDNDRYAGVIIEMFKEECYARA